MIVKYYQKTWKTKEYRKQASITASLSPPSCIHHISFINSGASTIEIYACPADSVELEYKVFNIFSISQIMFL